jgi:integrase
VRPLSPLHPDRYTKAFRRIAAKAGLPNMRLHDARRTYATLQLAGGVHPTVVSRALGHSSVAITDSIYAHVMPSHTEAAAAVIDAALGGTAREQVVSNGPRHV